MTELSIQIISKPEAPCIVTLNGMADLLGAEELDRRLVLLSAQRPPNVVFDLRGLKGISSICMGTLVRFRQGIARTGGIVTLAGATGIVLIALQRARLDQVFQMCESLDDKAA